MEDRELIECIKNDMKSDYRMYKERIEEFRELCPSEPNIADNYICYKRLVANQYYRWFRINLEDVIDREDDIEY